MTASYFVPLSGRKCRKPDVPDTVPAVWIAAVAYDGLARGSRKWKVRNILRTVERQAERAIDARASAAVKSSCTLSRKQSTVVAHI